MIKTPWIELIIRFLGFVAILAFTYALVAKDSKADTYVSALLGVANSGKKSLSESKLLNVGQREVLPFGLLYQYEAGGWADRAGQGRKSAGYGAIQGGVEAGDTVIARATFGPALITSPDAYLGGYFQFTEDFVLGIKGNNGNTVSMKYKHLSSAGIESPNVGRDFLGMEVSIPF